MLSCWDILVIIYALTYFFLSKNMYRIVYIAYNFKSMKVIFFTRPNLVTDMLAKDLLTQTYCNEKRVFCCENCMHHDMQLLLQ